MEDDDFGFTKRDNRALVKVLTVEKEGGQIQEEKEPSSAPTRAVAAGGSGGNNVPDRPKTSPSSVPNNTPNIPNVVEYHLKVKPSSKPYKHEEQSKNNRTEEMKNLSSSTEKKKDLITKLSRLSIDNNVFEGSTDLPQVFQVKYLGSHDARGLWGIKHTRQPVDNMVSSAKALPTNTMLPLIKLVVSQEGVALLPLDKRKQEANSSRMYAIENISYGVQDLVYTRVFSMIVVRETDNFRRVSPFECHGFVCESKHHARQLTYALATAFEIYSRNVKIQDKANSQNVVSNTKKRFAIDLRSPEEIEADLCMDSEA
ncbi:PREDICTED: uncharacterized protein LOC107064363 [Polistes dominula]|uniref:Uncharacterized protein LOC107064363 n=1 Tax=Polistes dominula TaxID=743375 RepID=A0ABM1HWZ8_POLDO|nr:PREDICTED: uncharacterized protein LOC107064363 [Polistes dominula]XP_015172487.1 PREDICTED: uncharacterized protein LOC107064363 [Polistes dominula]XP_015172488.1 PREDICTED: uncharacterized protein LOC107064363 [Polistes dominula]XP_015172489.1 PREDICTED: uncharacterized protein LOC107064363 [Polistes dominula]XP_015172490.1 PREDICTED: uncharacterized protein LOC107064363 [Polistes dominula]